MGDSPSAGQRQTIFMSSGSEGFSPPETPPLGREDTVAQGALLGGIFRHLSQFAAILCVDCRFAVPPDQIRGHLDKHHSFLLPSVRSDIVREAHALDGIAWVDFEVVYPLDHSRPVAGLDIIEGCFKCAGNEASDGCGALTTTKKLMQVHCRKKHMWASAKSRGGSKARRAAPDDRQMWTEGHTCQRLFKHPQWTKLFEVRPRTPTGPSQRQALGERMLVELSQKADEERRARLVTVSAVRAEGNAWLDHTAWHRHLDGFQPEVLRESIAEGLERDVSLERVCCVTGELVRRALEVCKPDIVPRAALICINRSDAGITPNSKPFYSGQQARTVDNYIAVWTKILRYLWRTAECQHRPAYRLTPGQKECLDRLRVLGARSDDGEGMAVAVRRNRELAWAAAMFWKSMLDHELVDEEFESGLISGLAVLGLDTEGGGWATPRQTTPKLAAIVTVAKALVVYIAWRTRHADVDEEGSLQGTTALAVLPLVRDMSNRFMLFADHRTGTLPYPMDRILRMKAYGMKAGFTDKGEARVTWRHGISEACIDSISVKMAELRTMIHGLERSCRERLRGGLMMLEEGVEMPTLDIAALGDDHGEKKDGYSFLHHPLNEELLGELQVGELRVPSQHWMWVRMLKDDHVADQLLADTDDDSIQATDGLTFNPTLMEEYLRQYTTFKEELIVLCHLTAGAPARGTEIVSLRHENVGLSSAQRGVFISEGGLVDLCTTYHKGFSHSKNDKVIHRFLPDEVGTLVVYYLWLIEPFVRLLLQEKREGVADESSYMWEPEPELVTGGHDGESGGEGASDDDGDDDINAPGAPSSRPQLGDPLDHLPDRGLVNPPGGRSTLRPIRSAGGCAAINADGFWNTERLKRVMRRECRKYMGVGFGPALWRHLYPAIQRTHCSSPAVHAVIDNMYAGVEQSTAITQAGHTRATEERIYGVLSTENPFSTWAERQGFEIVSKEWHRFLGFPSACGGLHGARAMVDEGVEASQALRWKMLRETSLIAKLKELVGPHAEFRGCQSAALKAIVERVPRVVVVMGTGGGKSLMYMLPASCSPRGVTVVVLPLTALLDDQERRCKELNIRVGRWGNMAAVRVAQVVLVTPESATTHAFGRFLGEKSSAGVLDRIVIDECHVVLDSHDGWRPKVLQLCEMADKGCQVVYLTATLPPLEEESLFSSLGVAREEITLKRASTSRANIRYRVLHYNEEDEHAEVQRMVDDCLRRYASPGQVVIYCKSVQQCKALGILLKCPVVFREMESWVNDSSEEGGQGRVVKMTTKRDVLQQLVQGKARLFVATNALGLGIDAPHIRVVLHVGVRAKITDYGQESGRAGRDGQKAEAILMRAMKPTDQGRRAERAWAMQPSMANYLEGKKCRRIVLDEVLDGRVDRETCEPGEVMCDVCLGLVKLPGRQRVAVRHLGSIDASSMLTNSRRLNVETSDDEPDDEHGGEPDGEPDGELELPSIDSSPIDLADRGLENDFTALTGREEEDDDDDDIIALSSDDSEGSDGLRSQVSIDQADGTTRHSGESARTNNAPIGLWDRASNSMLSRRPISLSNRTSNSMLSRRPISLSSSMLNCTPSAVSSSMLSRTSDSMLNRTSDGMLNRTPSAVSSGMLSRTSDSMLNRTPSAMSSGMLSRTSDSMLNRTSDGMLNRTPSAMLNRKSDSTLNRTSDSMLNRTPSAMSSSSAGNSKRTRGSNLSQSDIAAFTQGELRLREMSERRRERVMREAIDLDLLKRRVGEWSKVGCTVCWAQGRVEGARGREKWQDCRLHKVEANSRMRETISGMKAVRLDRFSGCTWCWLPQCICHRWEENVTSQGGRTASYRFVRERECQYKGVVEAIAAGWISVNLKGGRDGEESDDEESDDEESDDEESDDDEGDYSRKRRDGWKLVRERMAKVPYFMSNNEEVLDGIGLVYKWCGVKVNSNGIETTELVRLLYVVDREI